MNLGILQCDTVREEFASHGQHSERFATLLKPIYPSICFTVFDAEHGELPKDIHAADAYLITGSRHSVNDNFPWIGELEDFVRSLYQAHIKLIGICFGHQLIAKALGGKVVKWPHGWGVGMSQNKINQFKNWMQPNQNKFNLLVSHQDQVLELPKEAEILASSEFCPYYMTQIGSHVLTVQGHPEFTKAYSQALMDYRKSILGEELFQRGLESLKLPEDDALIAQWIVNFLQEH
ncbi:GMP synthase [Legionella sp. km772]|uniref:glutamine amidotransferase-related protein n=1 Tax=Legionella sp. km772 TaxID=2498111 RepID=UPI000F8DC728|nr:GMP synthase [Legionella sp. km772]RUR13728.1 GMP synthase [Legionella sp. km772]